MVRGAARENRDKLDSADRGLLEEETLDMDDAYAAAGVERPAIVRRTRSRRNFLLRPDF